MTFVTPPTPQLCDERRVTDMESHVKRLRDKLTKLVVLLPTNKNRNDFCSVDAYPDILKNDKVGFDDDLLKKEETLRKQIYELECTEKAYIHEIAQNRNVEKETDKKANNTFAICYDDQLQRSDHETFDQNVIEEAQFSINLLNKGQKNCHEKISEHSDCSYDTISKCESCDESTDGAYGYEFETDTSDNNINKPSQKCTCYITNPSSDSEESCDCLHSSKRYFQCHNHCNCKNFDRMSGISNCSSDDTTICSEQSKSSCFLSKNQSHEKLIDELDNVKNKTKRFKASLDSINVKSIVVSLENNRKLKSKFSTFKKSIIDQLQVEVDKLSGGFERLKIRNRNLEDFHDSFENPINLTNQPSQIACTELSNFYTINQSNDTHFELTSVKNFENKFRNKDALISALADELENDVNKKIQLKEHEVFTDKIHVPKTLSIENNLRNFNNNDSVISLLIFMLILISHFKRSEILTYLYFASQLPVKVMFFRNFAERFPIDFLSSLYSRITRFVETSTRNAVDGWKDTHIWLYHFFFTANQFYFTFISSVILAITFLTFRRTIMKHLRISEMIRRLKNLNDLFINIYEQTVSSKIFWLILGIYCHITWEMIKNDLFSIFDSSYKFYDEGTRKMIKIEVQLPEVEVEGIDWYLSIFSTKFQCLRKYFGNIFNVIRLWIPNVSFNNWKLL